MREESNGRRELLSRVARTVNPAGVAPPAAWSMCATIYRIDTPALDTGKRAAPFAKLGQKHVRGRRPAGLRLAD